MFPSSDWLVELWVIDVPIQSGTGRRAFGARALSHIARCPIWISRKNLTYHGFQSDGRGALSDSLAIQSRSLSSAGSIPRNFAYSAISATGLANWVESKEYSYHPLWAHNSHRSFLLIQLILRPYFVCLFLTDLGWRGFGNGRGKIRAPPTRLIGLRIKMQSGFIFFLSPKKSILFFQRNIQCC